MSRRELHNLVRNLRQYLQWQAVPLGGSVPADDAARATIESKIRERQKAALTRALEAPTPPARAAEPEAQVGPPRQPKAAAKKEAEPNPAAALWKDDTLGSGPRKTFAQSKSKPKPTVKPTPAATSTATESLADVRADLGDCRRCKLCEERKNIVFGVGSPTARLMFVGEAPGFNEDAQGEPFVGQAGELLDKMIVAMTLSRETVYIANVIKCRPPGNRDPEPEEVATCSAFLERQVQAVQPEAIVALGKFASNMLCGNTGALSHIRGQWQEWNGVPVMPTFHPAYLLRKPTDKGRAWDDLKLVMERLNLTVPDRYR